MSVVVWWSGREAWALRNAKRMSVREFAAHLGVNDSAVSNWEKRGEQVRLRYETQQLLDAALAQATDDVRRRFELIIGEQAAAGDCGAPERSQFSDPVLPSHAGRSGARRLAHAGDGPDVSAVAGAAMGSSSSARTRILLDTMQVRVAPRLRYVPPHAAVDRLIGFLESSWRVFVLKGPPGCGKTRLTHFLAREQAGDADFQLHSAASWDTPQLDLAADILRYASMPGQVDPLLTLERVSADLRRPCLVIIDGISSRSQLGKIGRQLDGIVRQVNARALRFLLVLRTPPDMELSAFPVLAASVFEASARSDCVSYQMSPWEIAEAREAWNRSKEASEPAFSDLPRSIQRLARLPLYMQLLKAAGEDTPASEVNAYRLVDYCVRSILRASGQDANRAIHELADLALSEAGELVPAELTAEKATTRAATQRRPGLAVQPLVRTSASGHLEFDHDAIREYFVATRIADLMVQRGRSAATVAALNDLAAHASTSATARGVFEFVVYCLDSRAPELVAAIALSPTVTVAAALPLMLRLAANGARFATDNVLRTCASRCSTDTGLELARALLAAPAIAAALAGRYAPWLTGLLTKFGSTIWPDIMSHAEVTLDAAKAADLLASADLDAAEEATFFARYFFLFVSNDLDPPDVLETLLGHPDWRVRAALAEGLRDQHAPRNTTAELIADRLVRDEDYKVRAAVARSVGHLEPAAGERHLAALLGDTNWHVRGSALQAVLSGTSGSPWARPLAAAAIDEVKSDPSWRRCPAQAGKLVERLLLLHGAEGAIGSAQVRQHALFILLRELRTGWIRLPDKLARALVAEGSRGPAWLVRRESVACIQDVSRAGGEGTSGGAKSQREEYRRRRDRRALQVALDLHDLAQAVEVAQAVAAAGTDFIEVGDPLIKESGLVAVEHIKRHVPHTAVVAEMMSADWGRDQVELAAEAGADVVLLIGPATTASVSAAVEAGRRLGVPILLDVPVRHTCQQWIRDMERTGVDGFAITTNIDLGVGTRHPLAQARAVRGWTRLPVAVSGGFSPADYAIINSPGWDILIVGRGVTEAVEPAAAAAQILDLVHGRGQEEPDDHHAA